MDEQQKELFELCREVYEQTYWDTDNHYIEQDKSEYHAIQDSYPIVAVHDDSIGEYPYFKKRLHPIYTSDYILEKLPTVRLEVWHTKHAVAKWFPDGVVNKLDKFKQGIVQEAETPLKALLKLTIALHDAGELK